jgi:hypothetical protein
MFTLPLAKETCEQGLACAHFVPSYAKHMWKSTLRTFREYGADTTVIVPCSTFQIVQTWVELREVLPRANGLVSSSLFLSNVELIQVAHYGKKQDMYSAEDSTINLMLVWTSPTATQGKRVSRKPG